MPRQSRGAIGWPAGDPGGADFRGPKRPSHSNPEPAWVISMTARPTRQSRSPDPLRVACRKHAAPDRPWPKPSRAAPSAPPSKRPNLRTIPRPVPRHAARPARRPAPRRHRAAPPTPRSSAPDPLPAPHQAAPIPPAAAKPDGRGQARGRAFPALRTTRSAASGRSSARSCFAGSSELVVEIEQRRKSLARRRGRIAHRQRLFAHHRFDGGRGRGGGRSVGHPLPFAQVTRMKKGLPVSRKAPFKPEGYPTA